MVKTGGLGSVIGRLVGGDRPDDQDAVDVPERCRPTTSARRLRVHQMTAEGRDMAEDVVDMTDDVLEQTTEAPEMRADAQGADSGEGQMVMMLLRDSLVVHVTRQCSHNLPSMLHMPFGVDMYFNLLIICHC